MGSLPAQKPSRSSVLGQAEHHHPGRLPHTGGRGCVGGGSEGRRVAARAPRFPGQLPARPAEQQALLRVCELLSWAQLDADSAICDHAQARPPTIRLRICHSKLTRLPFPDMVAERSNMRMQDCRGNTRVIVEGPPQPSLPVYRPGGVAWQPCPRPAPSLSQSVHCFDKFLLRGLA